MTQSPADGTLGPIARCCCYQDQDQDQDQQLQDMSSTVVEDCQRKAGNARDVVPRADRFASSMKMGKALCEQTTPASQDNSSSFPGSSSSSNSGSPGWSTWRSVRTDVVAIRFPNEAALNLDRLPNEILTHILSCLEVCDLLATSRTNHHLRSLSLLPILHQYRLRQARMSLPFLLVSPSRPTLADLIARHIFLTHTTQISRRLARSLVAIRLSRCLPQRPSAEALVQRGVLPGECVEGSVAPGLVAKKRAVERERLKDGLRRWVGGVWRGEVYERGNRVRRWEESRGVGRVWKLRRFWERVSKGDEHVFMI